ncbi:hypothetical protein SE956_04805 [Escherichia coli]|nr:hypothetical protein [Escherichia coli]MDW9205997.1 hypothetical protein [Escherichia coli]
MKKQIIKISWAKDSDGKVINVNDAIRDKDYYCPCCDEKLTLRAGNIKGNIFHTGMILNAIQNLSIINSLSFLFVMLYPKTQKVINK